MNVHRVTQSWTESVIESDCAGTSTDECTDAEPPIIGALGPSNPVTYDSDVNASLTINNLSAETDRPVDLTKLVQFWENNPSLNYGILLEADSAIDTYCFFYGRTWSPSEPKLDIVYVPIPEGDISLLFILGMIGFCFSTVLLHENKKRRK